MRYMIRNGLLSDIERSRHYVKQSIGEGYRPVKRELCCGTAALLVK